MKTTPILWCLFAILPLAGSAGAACLPTGATKVFHFDAPLIAPAAKAGAEKSAAALSWDDLAGKKFVFVSFDDATLSPAVERIPDLEFAADGGVSGGFCNRFHGKGELHNGFLTVSGIAMTRMFCFQDELNALERDIPALLEKGVFVTLDDGTLVMRQDGHSVVYRLL